jgi:alpha/beta superfamily hydrolase
MPLLSAPDHEVVTEDIHFSADTFTLHGELAYPDAGLAAAAVVIAGPHPLLGGNLRNNVVRSLGDGLARRGLLTLRFDYRGVGRSQGLQVDITRHLAEFWRTSHTSGEMDFGNDLLAATGFVRRAAPGLPLVLVGYSFGCALLPNVQPQEDLAALALIAPTVAKHDYGPYRSLSTPMLVVASEDDFATEAAQLKDWVAGLAMPRQLVQRPCDNHFFRGHEEWLLETVFGFLQANWR